MPFLLWLTILSCRRLSAHLLLLHLCSLRFTSSPTLCFPSMSFPLLFPVFLSNPSATRRISPRLYLHLPWLLLVSSFVFLAPVRPSAFSLSLLAAPLRGLRGHSPAVRGVIGDKQFRLCRRSPPAPARLRVHVCVCVCLCTRLLSVI